MLFIAATRGIMKLIPMYATKNGSI